MLDANNTGLVEHGCCCCLDVLSSMLSLIVVAMAVTGLRHPASSFPEHALCEYRCRSCAEKVRNTNGGVQSGCNMKSVARASISVGAFLLACTCYRV